MARQRFEDVFPRIRSELIDHISAQGMPKEAIQWYTNVRIAPSPFSLSSRAYFAQNLNYNVPGGKLNRGLSVVDSLQVLKGTPLTEGEFEKAAILGWCVELVSFASPSTGWSVPFLRMPQLQAFFLVSDDVMDSSFTRRGQPCWYKNSQVGLIAINDSFMLESAIYHLIKNHFRQESYYVHLIELFHETAYQTEMGQLIDLITAPEDHVDLSKFNLTKCVSIPVVHGTIFDLPVCTGIG